MYDVLLALHLLSAAIAFVTLVMFSAWAVGVPPTRAGFAIADWAWNVSGAGLLVFGVWLAVYIDGYELWDGWILGALVTFVCASVLGVPARGRALAIVDGGATPDARAHAAHWLRTLAVIVMLVLMIWKPGA